MYLRRSMWGLVGLVGLAVVIGIILPERQPAQARQSCDFTVGAGNTAELISAIQNANADPGLTSICLTNSTYTFTAGMYDDSGPTALPTITTSITIWGSGATFERQSADPFRFIYINGGGHSTFELHDLTLIGGDTLAGGDWSSSGGAILGSSGSSPAGDIFRLFNLTMRNNHAAADGGAIASHGLALEITNSRLDGNRAEQRGGAIFSTDMLTMNNTLIGGEVGNQAATGGGIALEPDNTYRLFPLDIENVTISGNRAVSTAWSTTTYGGGLALSKNVEVRIVSSAVLNNVSENGPGGGLYAHLDPFPFSYTTLYLFRGTVIERNVAQTSGGGMMIISTESRTSLYTPGSLDIRYNTAVTGSGGGIYIQDSNLSVQNEVRIEYNRAGQYGGAVYVQGNYWVHIAGAKVAYNKTGIGAAIQHDGPLFRAYIVHNCFVGNGRVLAPLAGQTLEIEARDNWWGSADGPSGAGSGSGDGVPAGIVYQPFSTTPKGMCGGPMYLTPTPEQHTATYLPSSTPTLPSPTASMTPTPDCAGLSLAGAELVGNRLQLLIRNDNSDAPVFISGVNVLWHKTPRYADMFADFMALDSQPRFWQGPDYSENTLADSTVPGWSSSDTPYTTRQIAGRGAITTWQIAFNNGPAVLSDYYALGDFNGTTLNFSRDWGGTEADCSITLDGLPTSTPPAVPPSATPQPSCLDYDFVFQDFRSNGVVHFSATNRGPSVVFITGFRLNWATSGYSAGPLDFVAVDGTSAFDPAAIILWDGIDNDSPTEASATGGNPGWRVNLALEPGQTRHLWFDFDATVEPLNKFLHYTYRDFDGSALTVEGTCESVYDPPTMTPTITPTLTPSLTPSITPTPTITITPPFSLTVLPGCSPVGYQGGVICASE